MDESQLIDRNVHLMVCNHIGSAIDSLLRGLQDLGQIIEMMSCAEIKLIEEVARVGFLISTISNLTEAFKAMKFDADFLTNRHTKHT